MVMHPARRVAQPGPEPLPRILAVACDLERIDVVLPPGASLLHSIGHALAPHRHAVLHLSGGGFGPFDYVMPALSPTAEHAAFYSDVHRPQGITRLLDGCVTLGTRDDAGWLHCHGFWTEAGNRSDAIPNAVAGGGHIIPDTTIIAAPITATAWITHGADFLATADSETNFTLFAPHPASPHPSPPGTTRGLAIRLRPNQDVCIALEQACAAHGITHAAVRGGVASIIGAMFADGRESPAFATEIYIRAGHITPGEGCVLDIALVNLDGALSAGVLRRGANPVLMTAELVIERLNP